MVTDKIKNSCFIVLLMLVCLSFSNYVLLSPFKIHYEISKSDLSEENTENSKENFKEIIAIFEGNSLNIILSLPNRTAIVVYEQFKLPSFYIVPNTPPPDLA